MTRGVLCRPVVPIGGVGLSAGSRMPMNGLNVVNIDCPSETTRSWLHYCRVCALSYPAVNPAVVSRLIGRRSASNTLGVYLGADIGSGSNSVSFVLIVFGTGSLDNFFFSSVK